MLLEQIQNYTKLSAVLLEWYAETSSKRYKVYTIPKRTGGLRTIEHPSKEIKALQRLINKILFAQFPVHGCATAYRIGSGIKLNASRHKNSNFTLHNDFESFFPSFSDKHVVAFLRSAAPNLNIELSEYDLSFIQRIVCRNGALTIGAPISPALTNLMMFDFDVELDSWCSTRELIYTRYADDIFVSSTLPNNLESASAFLRELASRYPFAKLRINSQKSAFLSRRYRRTITGLVISTERNISIGRDRKNKIKSDVYKYLKESLEVEDIGKLVGMLAFAKDVEPAFFATLNRKYGAEVLEELISGSFRRKSLATG